METSKNENLNQNENGESVENQNLTSPNPSAEESQNKSTENQESTSTIENVESAEVVEKENLAKAEVNNGDETNNETEDTVEEVVTDEHEDDDVHASNELEIPDYASMDNDNLLKEADKLLTQNVATIKEHFEVLKNVLLKSLDDERNEKLEEFTEEGNAKMDFEYHQPVREKFKTIYNTYRHKRDLYYKELNERLALNLEVKHQIIEDIKTLPNREDIRVPEKYKLFRELQERWKETGPVAKTDSKELYNNYHFHINNFYDFLRISNELRELDFKKNLEAKTALCLKAEALSLEEVQKGTFLKLQELHKAWREIGPTDKEHNEPIWERFSEATKKIHEKRHDYFEKMKESYEERLKEKEEVYQVLEDKVNAKITSHSGWQKAIKEVEEIRKKFKSFGPIHHPKNDEIWDKFREANRKFNQGKNAFYKSLKKQQHQNLELKKQLLARVNEIKNNDNWKETANELKQIQFNWKKIGYVPKVESDKIWNEFREACNHFFNRLTEHNAKADEKLVGNLELKKAILAEVKSYAPEKGDTEAKGKIQDFINNWREIGRVPKESKGIENEFNTAIDKLFDALDLDKNEGILVRFENKLRAYLDSDDKFRFNKELETVRRKIDEVKKEMNQLENNLGFFSNVDENNPMVRDVRNKINNGIEQVELLKEKLKAGREAYKNYENPPQKEEDAPEKDNQEQA